MSDKKTAREMIGELTRDAGLLTGVFGLLDGYLLPGERRRSPGITAGIVLCSVVVMGIGIFIERRRRQ